MRSRREYALYELHLSMHDQAKFMSFKIDPIISNSKAEQGSSRALEFAELIHFCVHDLLRQSPEFTQDLQLQFLE